MPGLLLFGAFLATPLGRRHERARTAGCRNRASHHRNGSFPQRRAEHATGWLDDAGARDTRGLRPAVLQLPAAIDRRSTAGAHRAVRHDAKVTHHLDAPCVRIHFASELAAINRDASEFLRFTVEKHVTPPIRKTRLKTPHRLLRTRTSQPLPATSTCRALPTRFSTRTTPSRGG